MEISCVRYSSDTDHVLVTAGMTCFAFEGGVGDCREKSKLFSSNVSGK